MPSFWLGLILLYILGLKLGRFPIAGSTVTAKGIVLPALTSAIYQLTKYVRQVRTVILDELHQDYLPRPCACEYVQSFNRGMYPGNLMEKIDGDKLDRARHTYTRALLKAVFFDRARKESVHRNFARRNSESS